MKIATESFNARANWFKLQVEHLVALAEAIGLEVRYRYGKQVLVKPQHFIIREKTKE